MPDPDPQKPDPQKPDPRNADVPQPDSRSSASQPANIRPQLTFDFARLRRHPDVEADNLFAVDASDRLILDEAATAISGCGPGELVVIDDHYGALTLGAIAEHSAVDVRVHQDAMTGQLALDANAKRAGISGFTHHGLGPSLLSGARVVLLQLPRSLGALDEIAAQIARHAASDVLVVSGGRLKHMSVTMNGVLGRHFRDVRASLGRQKSRVITARQPVTIVADAGATAATALDVSPWPEREYHPDLDLWIHAHGGVFAGTKVDIGTRFLLGFLDEMAVDAKTAIDLGCGTGLLATALARRRPGVEVFASDESHAAVASTRATAEANGVVVEVVRDVGLSGRADASADLVLLNPPFHTGSTVHAGIALTLFTDAARVLRPGGELWTVFNSHLQYRPALTRVVGNTRQAGRTNKFTVTVSTKR